MSLTKKILKNINILNGILIFGLTFFILKVLLPSYRVDVTPVINITNRPTEETRDKNVTEEALPLPPDYSIITENNLFHPERKFVIKPKVEEKPIPRPDFVLYGTLITGDVKVAYMEDLKSPYTTSGRGKRQRSVHLGEIVSGYSLSEIYNDRVVMVRGDDRIEVRVMDLSKQKHQKVPTPQPPQKAPDLRNRRTPVPAPQTPPQTQPEPPDPDAD